MTEKGCQAWYLGGSSGTYSLDTIISSVAVRSFITADDGGLMVRPSERGFELNCTIRSLMRYRFGKKY